MRSGSNVLRVECSEKVYSILRKPQCGDGEKLLHILEPPVLRLRLKKPRTDKKVQWTNGTVDNEHMNKKKSKCCCIYVKPREFGESSSESEGECENCFGHVEQKKKRKPIPDSDSVDSGGGPSKDPSSNNNGPGDSEPNVL